MNQNLTLRQLRAFAVVAELGSFTAAAASLSLTQSAISVLVRELEHALGTRVFDRHTRRVVLTEAGSELLPHATRALAEVTAAVASVGELRDCKRGRVRVAAPQTMASTLIARAMAAYSQRYPNIEIELTDTLTDQLVARVLAGDVDMAVGVEVPAVGADVQRQHLLRDRHWLVCLPTHPLARRRQTRWQDLTELPFIAPTRDFMRWVQPLLAPSGLQLKPAFTVGYMSTGLGLAAAGLGVTVMPGYGAPLAKGWGLVMRPLVAPVFARDVQIYTQPGRTLSAAAQGFVDLLFKQAAAR